MKNNKILDSLYYIFNPLAKTITFQSNLGFKQEDILMVINMNGNVMIYNFACEDVGGTMNGNILSFNYDTTLMSASDKLMVIVLNKDKTELYLSQILQELKDNNEILIKINNLKIN